jgi:ABC-type sugar transport system substrate-binding protein
MNRKSLLSLFAAAALLLVPAIASAQTAENKSAEVRTLTGCLSAGDSAHEYLLKTDEGATWELHSTTVKLSPHAGHSVTVTGRVRNATMHGAKEKTKDEMKEHGMDKDAAEHGHLNVKTLTMVSDSCKK